MKLPGLYGQSVEFDKYFAVDHLYRIGLQVDANRGGGGLSRGYMKTTLVQRAFNHIVYNQSVCKVLVLVGAKAVGGEKTLFGVCLLYTSPSPRDA